MCPWFLPGRRLLGRNCCPVYRIADSSWMCIFGGDLCRLIQGRKPGSNRFSAFLSEQRDQPSYQLQDATLLAPGLLTKLAFEQLLIDAGQEVISQRNSGQGRCVIRDSASRIARTRRDAAGSNKPQDRGENRNRERMPVHLHIGAPSLDMTD